MTAERKFLARLLVSLGVVAAAVLATTSPASAFAGGSGTAGDPYQISTCAHLLEIDDTTANLSKAYVLTANVDCSGVTVTAMVNGSTYFSGVLDGNNRSVSNVTVNCASTGCGLFVRLSGATVKDITLAGFTVTSTAGYVGTLAGMSSGTNTLQNITVTGASVTGTQRTGGLIGDCGATCTVSGVSTSGTIASSGDYSGGILALMGDNSSHLSTITNSSSSATVSGKNYAGGLLGYSYRTAYSASAGITGSSFSGTVSQPATNDYAAGGIAGYLWNLAVSSSSSTGSITGGDWVGGIVGWLRSGATVTTSWSSGTVVSRTTTCSVGAGGVVGSSESPGTVSRSYSVAAVSGVCRSGGVEGNGEGGLSNVFFRGSLTRTSGTDASFGGISGRGLGAITNSYASTTNAYTYGHGISGDIQYSKTCTASYWNTTTSTRGSTLCGAGGLGRTSAQLKDENNYSGWDFSTIWAIDPAVNDGYPYLRGLTAPPSPDTTAPTLTSGTLLANGQTVRLLFNEAIHATTAAASAFTVTASAANHTPTAVSVSGSNVDLTLPVTLEGSATVTVSYVAPASNSATSNAAVQDLAGNDAASFSNRSVTNNSTADGTAPTATWTSPSSPSSTRTLLYTLTFNEAVSGIASGDFRVLGTASGCAVTPSAALTSTSITVSVTCTSDGTVLLEILSNTVVDGSSNTGPLVNTAATQITVNTSVATTTTAGASSGATTTTVTAQVAATTTVPVSGLPGATTTTSPRSGSAATTSTSVAASGSTGGQAPEVTTTVPQTTSTVAPATTLPEIDVPETEVGGASALIGGVEVAATVTRENNELVVKVGPIAARIWAVARSGGKVPLDADGRLRLVAGDSVTVDIEGFDAGSPVEVRLYSDPVLLGRSQVGGSGTLSASYEIPEGVENGNHNVVLVGTGKGDDITLGLSVVIGDESAGINPWVIIVPIGVAVLGALLLPVALRRRRREAAA